MRRIDDYAIIGDCRSAALVSGEGSIDWLCWPRFDSPSIFGALLDERAGCWKIAPAGRFDVERRYVENTNVLQTHFQAEMGSLLVTDLMPVASSRSSTCSPSIRGEGRPGGSARSQASSTVCSCSPPACA
jgi:GH15 family glucan-1,4-alpha-glucosidase